MMTRAFGWIVAAAIGAQSVVAQVGPGADPGELQARLWLDREEDAVLHHGDRVRIYYRTTLDAYVAIVQIDTNGSVRLLHPSSPDDGHYVRGGTDYRLVFPRSAYWHVEDDPGVGYLFLVASPEPFDFSAVAYSYYDRGWDLTQVGRQVYSDPYVAMDDFVAALIPDWEYVPYALDFATYDVGDSFEYPRFLCYDCHAFRSFNAWNPYAYVCSDFRVVIYDDPYFYPARRYAGRNVVFVRPPQPFVPRYGFKERAADEPAAPLYTERVLVWPPGEPAVRRSDGDVGSGGVEPPMPATATNGPDRSGAPLRRPSGVVTGSATPPSGDPPSQAGRRPSDGRPRVFAPSATREEGRGGILDAIRRFARPIIERRPGGSSESTAPGARPPRADPTTGRPGSSAPPSRPAVPAARRPTSSTRPPSTSGKSSPPVVKRRGGGGDAPVAGSSGDPSFVPITRMSRPQTSASDDPRPRVAAPRANMVGSSPGIGVPTRGSTGALRRSTGPVTSRTRTSVGTTTRTSTPAPGARTTVRRGSAPSTGSRSMPTRSADVLRGARPATGSRPSASTGPRRTSPATTARGARPPASRAGAGARRPTATSPASRRPTTRAAPSRSNGSSAAASRSRGSSGATRRPPPTRRRGGGG